MPFKELVGPKITLKEGTRLYEGPSLSDIDSWTINEGKEVTIVISPDQKCLPDGFFRVTYREKDDEGEERTPKDFLLSLDYWKDLPNHQIIPFCQYLTGVVIQELGKVPKDTSISERGKLVACLPLTIIEGIINKILEQRGNSIDEAERERFEFLLVEIDKVHSSREV